MINLIENIEKKYSNIYLRLIVFLKVGVILGKIKF